MSNDTCMAAMFRIMPKELEDNVIFRQEAYKSWEDLFDKLGSYGSTKISIALGMKNQKKDDGGPRPMDIGSFSKGGKGKGKGIKGNCFN